MAERRPIVLIDGQLQELPNGDTTPGSGGGGGGGGGMIINYLPLVNPGAEEGNITGWTVASGSFSAVSSSESMSAPYAGTYMFAVGAVAMSVMYQDVDISSYASSIDDGSALLYHGAVIGMTHTDAENGGVAVEFFDGSSTLLEKRIYTMDNTDTNADYWCLASSFRRIPVGARTARFFLIGDRDAGTNNNVVFDDAFAGIVVNAAPGGAIAKYDLSGVSSFDVEDFAGLGLGKVTISVDGTFSNDGSNFVGALKVGGSYLASGYYYQVSVTSSNSSNTNFSHSTSTSSPVVGSGTGGTWGVGNDTGENIALLITVLSPDEPSAKKFITSSGAYFGATGNLNRAEGAVGANVSGALEGIRLSANSGTFTGRISVYGS